MEIKIKCILFIQSFDYSIQQRWLRISRDSLSTIREWIGSVYPSRGKSPTYVCLPSIPDELVDHVTLIVIEKVGGNDNPMLSEQIIAIVDKLLEYECITLNQHHKITSSFS